MSVGNDERQVYEDLKGFLLSPRGDLRKAATEAVLSQLAKESATAAAPSDIKMIRHGMVAPLAKNVNYSGEVGLNALKALVFMSSHGTTASQCIEDLMESGGMDRIMEIVLSSSPSVSSDNDDDNLEWWRKRVNYAMALLANMTRTEHGAVELVGRTLPDEAVASSDLKEKLPHKPTVELLLSRFLNPQYIVQNEKVDRATNTTFDNDNVIDEEKSDDPFQHFASVLMNATQAQSGRDFILRIRRPNADAGAKTNGDDGKTILQVLLPQLRSPNPLRRRGIAGMIRNCCLETDSSWWLLNVVKITKHILYPLAGPEELDVEEKQGLDPDLWLEGPDKKREPDHTTRLYLVESILLLCASGRKSREQLRLERVYVILKWADMVEEFEDVSEQINECVQFLRRDEAGTEEGSSDKFVQDAYRKMTANSPQEAVGSSMNFDAVD